MTSGEQPVYQYRVREGEGDAMRETPPFDDLFDAQKFAVFHPNAIIERRQVGPWEKVEQ